MVVGGTELAAPPGIDLALDAGKAWTTEATRDLLRWLLPGAIQENDVDRLNRRNSRRAEPRVSPIFTRADAEASLALLAPWPYEDWFEPLAGVRARLRNAGHILGSAFIEMKIDAEPRPVRLTISGDIGPQEKALRPDPPHRSPVTSSCWSPLTAIEPGSG